MMVRNDLVVYLVSGPAHMPYVTASIWSLRKTGYKGPVTLFAWPESIGFARSLEKDDRLGIWASEREPKYRRKDGLGRNSQGLDRIDLARSLDCDVCVYFDADTSIHGDITPLFEEAARVGYCATQWCDWTTSQGHTRSRVNDLRSVKTIPVEYIDEVVSHRWPSLNCGVFAARPNSELLSTWYDWCKDSGTLFISDEKTQHLLMAKYPNQMSVLMGGAFNCSHKFQPADLPNDKVVVYHYHGNSNVKKGKSPKALEFWWSIWEECLELNFGNIRNWWHLCGNKHLPQLMETLVS